MKKKDVILIWIATVILIMWGINRYFLMPQLTSGHDPSRAENIILAIIIIGFLAGLSHFGFLLVSTYNHNNSKK